MTLLKVKCKWYQEDQMCALFWALKRGCTLTRLLEEEGWGLRCSETWLRMWQWQASVVGIQPLVHGLQYQEKKKMRLWWRKIMLTAVSGFFLPSAWKLLASLYRNWEASLWELQKVSGVSVVKNHPSPTSEHCMHVYRYMCVPVYTYLHMLRSISM